MSGKILIAWGAMLVGACNANTAYPPPADNGGEASGGKGSGGDAGAAGANGASTTGGAGGSAGSGAATVGGGTGGSGVATGGTGGSGVAIGGTGGSGVAIGGTGGSGAGGSGVTTGGTGGSGAGGSGVTTGGTGGSGGATGGGTGGSGGSACTVDEECDSGHCLVESGACVECDVTINDCDAGSFCATSADCVEVEFSRLCESERITAGQSGIDPDDEALSLAAVALIDTCGDGVEGRAVAQSDPSVADAATGEPLIPGGEVLLVVGGPNANSVGGYVEREGIAPLYFEIAEGQYRYVLRSTGEVAYGTNLLDDTHDLLLFQVMRVPSGGLVVYGYGGRGAGSAAAGWFLAHVMIPSLSELDQAWYIYQWTDLGALGPDSSDDFVLRASGS